MTETMKVLVVDDNEGFCENLKDVLELKDYQVEIANNGLQGVELVKQNGYDLVLMDIKMPVMNGVDAFKKIKEITPSTPVIMVTAFAVENLIKEALREGAFGAMKKPLDFDILYSIIGRTEKDGALVLVVDDDEDLLANMKDVLSQKGYRVSIASDSNIAIKKARENKFDILLIDMKLPPLNGLETYLAIRDIRPDAVVIVITGHRDQMGEMVDQTLKESAYTCFEKPIDIEKLMSTLHQIEKKKVGEIEKPQ